MAAACSGVARQDREHTRNEGCKLFHVATEKLLGRLHRHFSVVGNQPRSELNVGFWGVHLR